MNTARKLNVGNIGASYVSPSSRTCITIRSRLLPIGLAWGGLLFGSKARISVLAAVVAMVCAGAGFGAIRTYNFGMDSAQEVPTNPSTGTGDCTVMLDDVSGAVSVDCTYSGLTGTATAAHIHGPAAPGVNAGVIVGLTQSGGMSGTITGGGTLSAANIDNMINGLTYVNLHTDFRAAGEIRGQVVAQPLSAFGLPHFAQGQAQLSRGPAGEVLISNLGNTGQDGVAIGLAFGEGLHVLTNLPPDANIPTGAVINYRCIATLPGGTDQLVMEQLTERTSNGFQITPDFSASGSPTYTMRLMLDGEVVFEQANRTGAVGSVPTLGAIPGICEHPKENPPSRGTSQELAVAQPWDLGGGQIVVADTLLSEADTVTGLPPGSTFRIELLTTGISSFSIPAEWLMMFVAGDIAQAHQALGEAQFDAAPGRLNIANIGSSGQDGVSIDFEILRAPFGQPPVRGVDIELLPLDLQSSESFNLSATGVFSGVPGSPLGQAGMQNNGGQLELSADFSPIGANTVRVEVYDAGQRVGSVDVPGGGVVGTLSAGARLDGCGKLPPFPSPPCFVLEIEQPAVFTPTQGGGPMTGDEFRLLAANATGTIDRLSFFDMRYDPAASGTFSIMGETLLGEPVPVPTYSEWGLVAFGLAVLAAGATQIRRRGRSHGPSRA